MAKAWSRAEEQHLLDAIPDYRKAIQDKEAKEVRAITKQAAEKLHKQHPILQGRTVNAIYPALTGCKTPTSRIREQRQEL